MTEILAFNSLKMYQKASKQNATSSQRNASLILVAICYKAIVLMLSLMKTYLEYETKFRYGFVSESTF